MLDLKTPLMLFRTEKKSPVKKYDRTHSTNTIKEKHRTENNKIVSENRKMEVLL